MRKMTIVALLAFTVTSSFGQLGKLKKKILGEDNPVGNLLKKTPPITTGIDDVNMEGALIQTFGNDSVYSPMTNLQRTSSGGFQLQKGFYEFHNQSYCLKAGTHGPGGGDGYMFAQPLGPMDEIVIAIVRNSVQHPQIPQREIQQLLWAIIARAKVEDLQNNIKLVAANLLTASQIYKLNGGALGLIPDDVMQRQMQSMPDGIRQVFEAEAKLRQMLTSPGTSFEQMERVAVLAGVAGIGPGSKTVPMGRWSLHPDGYYVRYLPRGYSYTVVQVWVPQGSKAVGKEYDPSLHIAVPGNTARQRLIQSGRPQPNQR